MIDTKAYKWNSDGRAEEDFTWKVPTSIFTDDPLKKQVGGDHYKSMKLQPIEFILANDLGFCEGNIIKYTCRYKQKGGVEDLNKVIHYAQMLIERERETK